MALVIKHTKTSTIPDGTDASLIRPSDWNADHSLAGVADITQGGTGATDAATARTNLGLGSVATENIVPIAKGGTGANSAQGAVQNLLPSQTGNAGKVLGTNGTTTSWVANGAAGGVTQIIAGTNVTIDPVSGVGAVTINASGGGSTIIGQTQSVSPFETSIGFEAGNANTGVNNTYLGFQAGRLMTGATNNVVIGYQALDNCTIPSSSVVIGATACGASTNITNCTVIGQNAAGTTTALGADNTLIGQDAGRSLTGASNIFIGVGVGSSASTATTVVAIGNGALSTTTSAAAGAVAVGHQALGSLTSGARNTAVGGQSGTAILTGSDNAFLGFDTGKLATGNENTFIGSLSGDAVVAGAANTFVGYNSGTAVTSGNNNTFVGRNSGGIVTTGSNNTFIGNYVGQSASLSGYVIISDGLSNQRIVVNNNGALSFNAAIDYGTDGFVLQTRGSGAESRWVNPNISPVAQFATNVSMLPNISVYFINCTSGNIIATLPSAAANVGLKITVKRVDQAAGNTLTVASAGGQVEGGATQDIGVSVAVQYCSDGTNWWELANG